MAVISLVLEKPLGENQEGAIIQCEEDVAQALVSGGIAREATSDEVSGNPSDDADPEETLGEDPDNEEDKDEEEKPIAARRLAANVQDIVVKAATKAAKNMAKVKAPNLNVSNVHVNLTEDKTGGFKSIGDMILTLIHAENGDHKAYKKIDKYQNSKNVNSLMRKDMTTTTSSAGGLLVPQQWSDEIYRLSFANVPNLLEMFTRYEMRNKIEHIPVLKQASASVGVIGQWQTEGSAITETDGVSDELQLTLNTVAVLTNLTDQLIRFANPYNLETFFNGYFPERICYKVNDSIVNGGNGQVNLIGNAATIAIDRAVANRITFPDVTTMYASMHDSYKREAVWLIQSSAITELFALAFPNASGTFPVFLPIGTNWQGGVGNLHADPGFSPVGTLLGRPVYPVENMAALGSKGDFAFVNFKSLAAGSIDVGAASTDFLYWNKLERSLRYVMYVASGNPLLTPYTRKDSSLASNTVVLDVHS